MKPQRSDLLTLEDACKYIGCCRTTLYNKEKSGVIRPVMWFGRKCYERSELDKTMEVQNGRDDD